MSPFQEPNMTLCYGREINLVDFLPKVSSQISICWPLYVCYSVEILFLLGDIALAIFLLKLFFTTVVWHKNLTCVLTLVVVVQIPAHLGRVVFIVYAVVYNFNTDYCDWLLIVASCCQMFYAWIIAHTSAGFLIERTFALLHLKDYERKSRRYISICIILFITTLGVYFVYSNTLNTATEFFAAYVVLIVFFNIVLFFVIILWNKRMIFRVSLSGKPQDYSLNKRFQLVENVRVLTLCKNAVIVASSWIIAVCGLLIYMDVFGWNPTGLMVFELLKSSGPLVVMITVIMSTPKWREHLLKHFRKKQPRVYVQTEKTDDTELYFKQLMLAWNAPKQ